MNGQRKPFTTYIQQIKGSELIIKMVPIPAGSFMMGSPSLNNASLDEGPEHKVELSAFWMADLEITWNLYNLFLEREVDKLDPLPTKGKEVIPLGISAAPIVSTSGSAPLSKSS